MSYSNVFIVSYGRTGSTVLMALLNTIPGYLIRGENADLVGHLLSIEEHLRPHTPDRPTTPTHPWFGAEHFTADALSPLFRRMIDGVLLGPAPPADVRCYGFKEIRYGLDDVEAKLEFLRRLYPGCAFVFSVRATEHVARSEFHRGVDEGYFDAIQEKFVKLADAPDCFVVRHEALVNEPETLLPRLFGFLGETYDADRVRAVLDKPHGYSGRLADSFRSDFPFYVRAGSHPDGIGMLYVNRFERSRRLAVIGGFVRAEQPELLQALKVSTGEPLRFRQQQASMRKGNVQLPVTQFLIEIDCPPSVERLEVVLPGAGTLLELTNLRHRGRNLGRRG